MVVINYYMNPVKSHWLILCKSQQQRAMQQVKNTSAWKSLTQGAQVQQQQPPAVVAPQPPAVRKPVATDAFLQFKNKAKEKADRQRQLDELQENRRRENERMEKERQRQEAERRQRREEEEALEKARRSMNVDSAPLPAPVTAIK